MIKRHFTVAGCGFDVHFDDAHPFGEHLANYMPFLGDSGESLFSLRFDDGLETPEKTPLIVGIAEPEEPGLDVYRCDEGLWVESAPNGKMAPVAHLLVPSEGSTARLKILDRRFFRFATDNALMFLFALKTSGKDALEMHSSVVEYQGKGYMFLGVSGTGKSTHSRMWMEAFPEAKLLNDDNPVVRVVDGVPYVFGTPWSGKTPCYRQACEPLGAIVRLRQAPENIIAELSLPEAYAEVYSSTSGFKADEAMADALHETIVRTVTSVKCYVLDCLPDTDAAILCNKAVTTR